MKSNIVNDRLQLEDLLERFPVNVSLPRINFKKVKLSKLQNLDNYLKTKNITKVMLDTSLLELDLPVARSTPEIKYDIEKINPLRKKTDVEIKLPSKEKETKEKNVTFNLEAEIATSEENVIFSPSVVSMPPLKEDVISSSGDKEDKSIVWPPEDKKAKKEIEKKEKKQTYFLSEEKPEEKKTFPWLSSEQEYQSIENVFEGGLETELLDVPSEKPSSPSLEQAIPQQVVSQQAVLKAIYPEIPFDETVPKLDNLDIKDIKFDSIFLDKSEQIELSWKVEKVFEKLKSIKLTPVRIIIVGGLATTLGYLLWTYFPGFKTGVISPRGSNKVVVRDIFKKTHSTLEETSVTKEKPRLEEKIIEPVTEKEREELIQMAREALENRLDPFGQEAVLPQSVIEEKAKQEEMKTPPDIPMFRKQVELVGIISTENKNLGLVNVYVAEYTVSPSDDKVKKEEKLKIALNMAVPNRIEVSLLDPVEDWYVKQISKGKTRTEDPTIELVKGDKKFKLKVGQKVLLPEEKQEENIKDEDNEENK
ncbi:MAG: hypothetical protein HYY52_03565 [Candidatus Melainabacteria bacterium]|nr:hypothetical protein [Candidatus Melainabacteria bacterium]